MSALVVTSGVVKASADVIRIQISGHDGLSRQRIPKVKSGYGP